MGAGLDGTPAALASRFHRLSLPGRRGQSVPLSHGCGVVKVQEEISKWGYIGDTRGVTAHLREHGTEHGR